MTEHAPTRRPADPRAVAIAGLSTFAWYAVPDVVGPRWARALAKSAVATTGVVLTVAATAEGREAREGARQVCGAIRSIPDRGSAEDLAGGPASDAAPDDPAREDNVFVPDHDARPVPVPPGLLAAAAVGGVAAATTLAVAGEKWAYRCGERLRARGVRMPHARVGLVLGGLAVALAALEPLLWNPEDGSRP